MINGRRENNKLIEIKEDSSKNIFVVFIMIFILTIFLIVDIIYVKCRVFLRKNKN
jgi:heme/copper-type cytochrome/quinol oxidase subunit 2